MTYHLPETGYLRLNQIVGNPKADPPIPPLSPSARHPGGLASKKGAFQSQSSWVPTPLCGGWRTSVVWLMAIQSSTVASHGKKRKRPAGNGARHTIQL